MTLQLNKLQTKKNQHHLVDGIQTEVIIQNLLTKIISEIITRINYQLLSNAQIVEELLQANPTYQSTEEQQFV